MDQTRTRAVVVGGSIAGLLSAAAVSEHVDEVVVLDRDRLPEEAVSRGGVPHARHSHVLLDRGCAAVEALLPGAIDEMVALGAAYGDGQRSVAFHFAERPLAVGESGLHVLAADRETVEGWLRRRVGALPNVEVRSRSAVLGLEAVPGRITGVRVSHLDRVGGEESLAADLVVDASGRSSRVVERLASHGLAGPPEEQLRLDGCYVTRRFVLPEGQPYPEPLDQRDLIVQLLPGPLSRTAVMARTGPRAWSVTLAGFHGAWPPDGLRGFVEYAASVPGPIAGLLPALLPVEDAAVYRLPKLVRRRVEDQAAPPDGLVILGDARCSIDAAGGFGMSMAAVQAHELRSALRGGGLSDLPRRHYRRTAPLVEAAWAAAHQRYDDVVGLAGRVQAAYIRRYLDAATVDPVLSAAFFRVLQMHADPTSLLAPPLMARALAGGLPEPTPDSGDVGTGHPVRVAG